MQWYRRRRLAECTALAPHPHTSAKSPRWPSSAETTDVIAMGAITRGRWCAMGVVRSHRKTRLSSDSLFAISWTRARCAIWSTLVPSRSMSCPSSTSSCSTAFRARCIARLCARVRAPFVQSALTRASSWWRSTVAAVTRALALPVLSRSYNPSQVGVKALWGWGCFLVTLCMLNVFARYGTWSALILLQPLSLT